MMEGLTHEILVQFGAVGVLGVSFVVLLKWALQGLTNHLKAIERSIKTLSVNMLDMHMSLTRFEANARCLSPDDKQESNQKAYDAFQEVLVHIKETRDMIKTGMH